MLYKGYILEDFEGEEIIKYLKIMEEFAIREARQPGGLMGGILPFWGTGLCI